ncbi:hypothetical protein R7E79_21575 [Vibrio sp. Vb2135]|uniref:P-loop NTPase fold protein n=1 Tax=Vibrio sp. Vb2135 TaxID=3074653 RepID=UPI0029649B32|nr:P-loop NTPase fold protein [Vibrio sp. Vb2135]MDW1764929.1 hypothetical protein [Vibrio sp. Vb2135]
MKIETRIHNLLEDSSFPSILLLDGHWGVGKTFYVKNILKPYLESEYDSSCKSYYLSLYGVSSLDDFKDRLLSVVLTKKEKTGWLAQKSNTVADFSVQAFEGTRGVGKALGSIGSIVKQYYFNQLDNLLLFIDDLERISCDRLKSVILGECLNLCENKRIRIVVIGNQEKIESKADIEKAFSDVVSFSRTPAELVSVLDKIYTGYKALSYKQKQLIEEMLNKHKVDNIRVIRRAIERFNAINSLFSRDARLDYTQVDKNNFITSFVTCIAIYHYGFSLDEVVQTLNENPYIEHKTKGETDEDKRKELIRNLVHPLRYNANENHIRFFATYENTFSNISVELKLPVAANELQEILDYKFRRNDDDWLDRRLPKFKKYIETPDSTEFVTWSRACSVYVFLIENNYINDNLNTFISKAKDTLKIFTFSTPDEIKELRRQLHYYTDNKEFNELLSEFLSNAAAITRDDQIISYKKQFIESWKNVENQARDKYMHVSFLQHFGKQDFELMLDNWSNEDIDKFDRYVHGRYDFNNIEDFFADELNALKTLLDCVALRKKRLSHGAKLGVLSEFESQISLIYERLKEKIAAKTKN